MLPCRHFGILAVHNGAVHITVFSGHFFNRAPVGKRRVVRVVQTFFGGKLARKTGQIVAWVNPMSDGETSRSGRSEKPSCTLLMKACQSGAALLPPVEPEASFSEYLSWPIQREAV